MVLGLIEFLLGGKKKNAPKRAQVGIPVSNNSQNFTGNNSPNVNQEVNNHIANPVNNDNLEFQDSSVNQNVNVHNNPVGNNGVQENVGVQKVSSGRSGLNKRTVSDVLRKLSTDVKEINENIASLSSEIKDIKTDLSSLDHRVSEIESDNKIKDEKLSDIDASMNKFLSLYEIVNNQYNPFVSEDSKTKPKTIVLSDGATNTEQNSVSEDNFKEKLNELTGDLNGNSVEKGEENLESSLLELDTIDLDSAASNAVPLTHLKTTTNSLVIILSWLEYLVNKAGITDTKKTLTYYTETLKWITPEVYFELDKFLRGMDDIAEEKREKLNVRDHIVSLYFLSKLNEKKLDERLTKAVLQIIKEK